MFKKIQQNFIESKQVLVIKSNYEKKNSKICELQLLELPWIQTHLNVSSCLGTNHFYTEGGGSDITLKKN